MLVKVSTKSGEPQSLADLTLYIVFFTAPPPPTGPQPQINRGQKRNPLKTGKRTQFADPSPFPQPILRQ